MDVSFYFVVSFITIFINCIYTLENIPELHKCNEFCKRIIVYILFSLLQEKYGIAFKTSL